MTLYSNNHSLIVTNEEKRDKLSYSATVQNLRKGDIISVPFLYYPYYELKISENGKTVLKEKPTESYNGMIQFNISKNIGDTVDINIYYKPSLLALGSYLASAISVITFIIYIICFSILINRQEENN